MSWQEAEAQNLLLKVPCSDCHTLSAACAGQPFSTLVDRAGQSARTPRSSGRV